MVYCDWEYQLHYKLENGFFIGETLVTQELYELVMGENPSLHKDINKYPNAPKHPIENVSWYEAIIFCNKLSEMNKLDNCYTITNIEKEFIKLYNQTQITADVSFDGKKNGYRLPFLDEWTYAARAGTKNKYPGTNVLSAIEDYMWTLKNSKNQTHPVAMKKPNEWGIYDMLGNVKEWSQQGLENATNRKYVRTIGYNDQPYDTEKDYISDLSSLAKEQKSNATGFRIVRNF
jgi:formylglycine-generating enzyme required for sulfatase activity